MTLLDHDLKQYEQIQIDTRELNAVHDFIEMVSLASCWRQCEFASSRSERQHFEAENSMTTSRREALMEAATGLLAGPAGATSLQARRYYHEHVAALVRRSADANGALMRGDIGSYRSLIVYSDDFTFMSPFGGPARRRAHFTDERMKEMGRSFRNGVFDQELVEAYVGGNLVVLVLVERQRVEVGGLPAQDWPLRVTLVYRREGAEWQLTHRHADPLFHAVGLEGAASLASGENRQLGKK